MSRYLVAVYYGPGITHDPITGSPVAGCDDYGNPTMDNPTGVFWSGIYDDARGCDPTPKCFPTGSQMQAYATQNGLILKFFNNAQEVATFCKNWVRPAVSIGGPTTTGGVSDVTIVSGGGGNPPGFIPSPGTPLPAGGLPGGAGTAGAAVNPPLNQIFRFILYTGGLPGFDPHTPYGTGANYPGCSQVNITNCQAKAFTTLDAAVQYALAHNEIPYKVLNKDEPWQLISGAIPMDPSRILHGGMFESIGVLGIAIIAGALWFLSGR